MAKLEIAPRIEIDVRLKLNYDELMALDAISGYGCDEFLKVFYEKLGKAYLEPHEKGLRELFSTIRTIAPSIQDRRRKAVEAFTEK